MVITSGKFDFPKYKLERSGYSFLVGTVLGLVPWFFPQVLGSNESFVKKLIVFLVTLLIVTLLPTLYWVVCCLIVVFRRLAKYAELQKEIERNKTEIDQLKSYLISLVGLVSQGNIFVAQDAYSFNGKVYVNIKSGQSQFDEGSEFILIDKSDEYTYGIFKLVQNNAEGCVLQAKSKLDPMLLGYLTNGNRITFPPGIVVIRLRTERNYGRQKN